MKVRPIYRSLAIATFVTSINGIHVHVPLFGIVPEKGASSLENKVSFRRGNPQESASEEQVPVASHSLAHDVVEGLGSDVVESVLNVKSEDHTSKVIPIDEGNIESSKERVVSRQEQEMLDGEYVLLFSCHFVILQIDNLHQPDLSSCGNRISSSSLSDSISFKANPFVPYFPTYPFLL